MQDDSDTKFEDVSVKKVITEVLPMLWPADNVMIKVFVVLSFMLLLVSKITDLFVPISMKYAIDDLTNGRYPMNSVLMYGVFRFLGEFLTEMRTMSYAQVSAALEKKIAADCFRHLQALSLRYHLDRKTGSVLRSVSRGALSFTQVAQNILFQFAPIIMQVTSLFVHTTRYVCLSASHF
jgi:ABC-type multidrug transport system fused ATPase/permease subunit